MRVNKSGFEPIAGQKIIPCTDLPKDNGIFYSCYRWKFFNAFLLVCQGVFLLTANFECL